MSGAKQRSRRTVMNGNLIEVRPRVPTAELERLAGRFEAYLNGNGEIVELAKRVGRREIRRHVQECMRGIIIKAI